MASCDDVHRLCVEPVGVALLPTGASRSATLIGTYGLSGVLILIAA
jgi:hypothetical protein